MSCHRGTSNKNQTGSASSRRARRQWILDTFGDGTWVQCYRCPRLLDFITLTVDRIRAGMDGGRYTRDNIRPACMVCNIYTGNKLRDHRRLFPYLAPVKFKKGHALYKVIEGEGEDLGLIQNMDSGYYRVVAWDRLEAA